VSEWVSLYNAELKSVLPVSGRKSLSMTVEEEFLWRLTARSFRDVYKLHLNFEALCQCAR